jgi:hypothetical protein
MAIRQPQPTTTAGVRHVVNCAAGWGVGMEGDDVVDDVVMEKNRLMVWTRAANRAKGRP